LEAFENDLTKDAENDAALLERQKRAKEKSKKLFGYVPFR
jgi:hypothetical protein